MQTKWLKQLAENFVVGPILLVIWNCLYEQINFSQTVKYILFDKMEKYFYKISLRKYFPFIWNKIKVISQLLV